MQTRTFVVRAERAAEFGRRVLGKRLKCEPEMVVLDYCACEPYLPGGPVAVELILTRPSAVPGVDPLTAYPFAEVYPLEEWGIQVG